jgi:tetratricopeptide (TPR) repeat protein
MSERSERERALRIDRFMRLPRRTGEVWQGGGALLPFFVEGSGHEPERQAAIVWANLATDDVLLVSATVAESADPGLALEAFLDLGLKSRKVREGRPARIEVRDAALGAFIKDALGDDELEVAVIPALARIDAEVARIVDGESGGVGQASRLPAVHLPGALDAPGVDVDRLRAFAEAARDCRAREIWYDIGDDDLVLVEEPIAPDGMAGFVASVSGGAPAIEFYSSREEFDEVGQASRLSDDLWRVEFVHLHELPIRDVSPWADMGLPVGAHDGYPVVLKSIDEDTFVRPDAARLAFVEGLLRVLGDTTEAEIDSGRWSRTVQTSDGAVTCRLSMPSLLDEQSGGDPDRRAGEEQAALLSRLLDEGQFETLEDAVEGLRRRGGKLPEYVERTDPAEKAEDLVYAAAGAPGRRKKQLLRQALALSPNCFRAHLHLAEGETRPERAFEIFEIGRSTADRAIGPERLGALKGRFWEDRDTRAYVRLRMGLALSLRNLGRLEEAATHLAELLDLDEGDHAGARDCLLAVLLELRRNDEAAALRERFEDGGAAWHYGAALLDYRRGEKKAGERLHHAYLLSPLAAELLVEAVLGPDRAEGIGPRESEIEHEDEDAATDCVELLAEAWADTTGAAEWMASELRKAARRRPGRRLPRRR